MRCFPGRGKFMSLLVSGSRFELREVEKHLPAIKRQRGRLLTLKVRGQRDKTVQELRLKVVEVGQDGASNTVLECETELSGQRLTLTIYTKYHNAVLEVA